MPYARMASINILSLVLEDDRDVLNIIQELLDKHGITNYKLFTSEKEFMENLTADIHVCVLDHYIPGGKTGLDVCAAVKAVSKDSYIIIISGQQKFDVVVAYLNGCADKYIDKNDPNYLELLVKFMNEGIEIAKRRVIEVDLLTQKRKEIQERRKLFEP